MKFLLPTALAAVAVLALAGQAALAQSRRPNPGRPAARPAPAKVDAGAPSGGGSLPMPTATGALVAGAPPSDAGVVESKTLDGGTHVFKFSELDIEGRLKSPQLVYFLRRVRAEFSAGDLGHRSFMREMSETRKESSF